MSTEFKIFSDVPELDLIGGAYALYFALETRLVELAKPYDLTRGERAVIISLMEAERPGSLAQRLKIAPSTMTLYADKLFERGLLERVTAEDDRRAVLLSLTPEGRAVQSNFTDGAIATVRENVALSKDELNALNRLLKKAVSVPTLPFD